MSQKHLFYPSLTIVEDTFMAYIYQKNDRNQKGVTGPKPRIDIHNDIETIKKIRNDYENGRSVNGLMTDYHLSRATIYRILKSLDLT